MIEKQREKEFLFELERLYHNYNLVIGVDCECDLELREADHNTVDRTTQYIEAHIDELRAETLEDVR